MIHVICPFHRGDILITGQVLNNIDHPVTLWVDSSLACWATDFSYNFAINVLPLGGPPFNKDIPTYYDKARAYISDTANIDADNIVCFHDTPADTNIADGLLARLPIKPPLPLAYTGIEQVVAPHIQSTSRKQTALLHASGGWNLKSLPAPIFLSVVKLLRGHDFHVVQIGGPSDKQLPGCDSYVLSDFSPAGWGPVFRNAALLIGVDSWSSHFAAIVNTPSITLFGSTTHQQTTMRHLFSETPAPYINLEPSVTCSPCHSFACPVYAQPFCMGYFRVSSSHIEEALLRIAA